MVKERQELKQRTDALTDPLTGLPNRRALFEAAERLAQHSKYLKGDPISVLVFDLDHFKKINDTFGHRLGDRVLQAVCRHVVGEPESPAASSGDWAGRSSRPFCRAPIWRPPPSPQKPSVPHSRLRPRPSTALAVAGTVSVGAAAHDDIDCDLGTLFHRADGALYAAKSAGRNRVGLLGPHEAMRFDEANAALRSALDRRDGQDYPSAEKWGSTRRYRRSVRPQSPAPRPRRGGPALS